MKCELCGEKTCCTTTLRCDDGVVRDVCDECYDKKKRERISKICDSVVEPSSFQGVRKEDLSECFWTHLGIYAKHPNKKSLGVIHMAFLWACHDDHGLSNSFLHAMEWADVPIRSIPADIPEDADALQ